MKIEVIGIPGVILELKAQVQKNISETADFTEQTARSYTPVRSGNAQRNWQQTTSANGFSVYNRTPYIGRLDEGYSRQQPRGITTPTIEKIQRRVKK